MITQKRSPKNRDRKVSNVTKEGKDEEVRGPPEKHNMWLGGVAERENRENRGQA